jgi:hypothetical protein
MSAEIKAAQPPAVTGTPFDFTAVMMVRAGHFTVGFVAPGKDRALERLSGLGMSLEL